jgi:hypothetical protein
MAKPMTERRSREQLIAHAREHGCEQELLTIFKRYDDLLKGCKTAEERNAVATMGVLEVDSFFGGKGNLSISPRKL